MKWFVPNSKMVVFSTGVYSLKLSQCVGITLTTAQANDTERTIGTGNSVQVDLQVIYLYFNLVKILLVESSWRLLDVRSSVSWVHDFNYLVCGCRQYWRCVPLCHVIYALNHQVLSAFRRRLCGLAPKRWLSAWWRMQWPLNYFGHRMQIIFGFN